MRKIEEVMKDIKYGNVLRITNNSTLKVDKYSACILKYDGKILVDVREVEIGNFLDQLPNIKSKLNAFDYYQLKYDFDLRVYQSAIMHKVRQDGYKELFEEEVLDDLATQNFDLIDSIIDLDVKISQKNKELTRKNKIKELVS